MAFIASRFALRTFAAVPRVEIWQQCSTHFAFLAVIEPAMFFIASLSTVRVSTFAATPIVETKSALQTHLSSPFGAGQE
jgi:hypothetical protein